MIFNSIHSSSSANLYTLESDTSILIEAGLSGTALKKAVNYKLTSYIGCLVTHSHVDHIKGWKDVVNAGVDLYVTKETTEKINAKHHRIHIIEPREQFTIGGWIVLPFKTQHDCPGSVGFLIEKDNEKLVFITDSYYCKYKPKGLTHICIECNWSHATLSPNINYSFKQKLYHSHFNLERVCEFLLENDLSLVKEIHLMHLSDKNSDEKMFKETIQKLTGKPTYICKK